MTDGRPTWGKGIRILRRIHDGMTQEQLATLAGVSQSTISRLERGSYEASDAARIRIAKALEVDPNILFPYVDPPETEAAS